MSNPADHRRRASRGDRRPQVAGHRPGHSSQDRRDELVGLFMAWHRKVRSTKGTPQERAARAGVHAAKVALGERGAPPWWEQTDAQRTARWRARVPEPD